MADQASDEVRFTGIVISGVVAILFGLAVIVLFWIIMSVVYVIVEITGIIAFLVFLYDGDDISKTYPQEVLDWFGAYCTEFIDRIAREWILEIGYYIAI